MGRGTTLNASLLGSTEPQGMGARINLRRLMVWPRLRHFRGAKGGEVTTPSDIIFLKSEWGGEATVALVCAALPVSVLCPETRL